MSKDEALQLALEVMKLANSSHNMVLTSDPPQSAWRYHNVDMKLREAISAIKAALEAKDEPVKLRRGDILRCNESDELCTVWATSTSGKTLVKWKDNDFGNYTAEQIGELFWIEPKEKDEPDYKALWQQMCERCDELDKKLAQRTWVGLTDKEIEAIWKIAMFTDYGIGAELSNQPFVHYARAIEAKLKEKNT